MPNIEDNFQPDDQRWMDYAIRLGHRGSGLCAPNPSVGCVVVKNNVVLAASHTAVGGRPHAEPQALATAGAQSHGATVYVTLEPCHHHGQTPPCTVALVQAGAARVVVGCLDRDPRVCGRGVAFLREQGIAVTTGVQQTAADSLHAGFFYRLQQHRPWVTLKIATSADGIASHPTQRWLTGSLARRHGHRLRADHDAIMVGIGTVLADDPRLDCRLPGLAAESPVRVVLDRHGKLPDVAQVTRQPFWWLTDHPRVLPHATVFPATDPLATLAQAGITRLLIEGGIGMWQAFWDHADAICWYRSPHRLGNGHQAVLPAQGMAGWTVVDQRACGEDSLQVYQRVYRNH